MNLHHICRILPLTLFNPIFSKTAEILLAAQPSFSVSGHTGMGDKK